MGRTSKKQKPEEAEILKQNNIQSARYFNPQANAPNPRVALKTISPNAILLTLLLSNLKIWTRRKSMLLPKKS